MNSDAAIRACAPLIKPNSTLENAVKAFAFSTALPIVAWHLLRITFLLKKDAIISQRALKKVRLFMESCDRECDTTECLFAIRGETQIVQGNYRKMADKLEGLPNASRFVKGLRELEDEWGEIALDCDIAADPDIRASIRAIAAAL